ncbi:hypothetical protein ACOSQ4_018081 [Xanthoceras sorbifolium]
MSSWWTFLWKLNLPNRIKVFLWRISHDGIPCFVNLAKHHVLVCTRCQFCLCGEETTTHALWFCCCLQSIRTDCNFTLSVPDADRCSMFAFLLLCRAQLPIAEFHLLAFVLWQVWYNRNCKIHNRKCLPLDAIVSWCKVSLVEFSDQQSRTSFQRVPLLARWIPPIVGCFKVNTDAALNLLHGRTGLGAVLRNNRGEVLLAGYDVFDRVLAPDLAEAKAVFFGLSIACHGGLPIHFLESDASSVISLLNRQCDSLAAVKLIIDDIHDLLHSFNISVVFSHVPRAAN